MVYTKVQKVNWLVPAPIRRAAADEFTVADSRGLGEFTVADSRGLDEFTVADSRGLGEFTVADSRGLGEFTVADSRGLDEFTVADSRGLGEFTVADSRGLGELRNCDFQKKDRITVIKIGKTLIIKIEIVGKCPLLMIKTRVISTYFKGETRRSVINVEINLRLNF